MRMSRERLRQVSVKVEDDAEDWVQLDDQGMELLMSGTSNEEDGDVLYETGRRYPLDRRASAPAMSSGLLGRNSLGIETRRDGRRRSVNWSVRELDGLLSALGRSPHLRLLMSSEHLSCINEWETVAHDMGMDGFSRTADQCRLKMKNLRRIFHHLRLGWVSGGRHAPDLPPWFARMKDLWSQAGKPQFKTPFIEAMPRRRYRRGQVVIEDNEAEAMGVKGGHEEMRKDDDPDGITPSQAEQATRAVVPRNITSVRRRNGVKIITVSCEGSNEQSGSQEEEEVQNVPNRSSSPPCPVRTLRSSSSRSCAEQPQSSDEPLLLTEQRPPMTPVSLLQDLNIRLRRLEDSQKRTNELLQQLITIQTDNHRSSEKLLQEVVQRLDYSNQHMAMVGLLGHLGLVAKNQAVPGLQVPTVPPFLTPGTPATAASHTPSPASPSSSHQSFSQLQPVPSAPNQTELPPATSDPPCPKPEPSSD